MQSWELVKSSHSVGESNFHLIFCPAYMRKIFTDWRVKELTRAYILQKAKDMDLVIVSMEFGPDHVHIFVANCRGCSAAQVVQHLKGFSSYMMRKHHSDILRRWFYGKKFWSSGYFYRSIGSTTTHVVRKYIEIAQEKHWHIFDKEDYAKNGQRKLNEFDSSNTQGL